MCQAYQPVIVVILLVMFGCPFLPNPTGPVCSSLALLATAMLRNVPPFNDLLFFEAPVNL
jgi:hypothetical protein